MTSEWLDQHNQQRLDDNSKELARHSERLDRIDATLQTIAHDVKVNKSTALEIKKLLWLSRWILKAIAVLIGFGLFLVGKIPFSDVTSFINVMR
jgi:ABC-type multidrug transport system fused ATPase/permease subunit